MIFKVVINFMYATLSGGTLLQSVMSQQYNCRMELYTNFTRFTFHENISSPSFILRYGRAKVIVHAFMIELDQSDF